MSEQIGQTLGKFKIERELGRGGMGVVYQARHIELGRTVAIKVMHPHFTSDSAFRARFRQEALIAAQLNHPGIVTVTDFDAAIGYIVMEFILGDNLQDILTELRAQDSWIGVTEAVQLICQVGSALHYVHSRGVLHRDIKPSNIMISPSREQPGVYQPIITDLGLARLKVGGIVTRPDSTMGTPAYMSPEQAMGQNTDPRSDVYSLGVLLYELAVGELPFPIQTLTDALRYHVYEAPPAPRARRADLPGALEQVILCALAKTPGQRYSTTAEMVKALSTIPVDTLPTTAPPTIQKSKDLFAVVQEHLIEPQPVTWSVPLPPMPIAPAMVDSLQILIPNGEPTFVAIHTSSLLIGRDAQCAVRLLNDDGVSRQHVRITIDHGLYQVTDLNSSNGTWIGSQRLTANQPERWTPEQPLQIGSYHLRLHIAKVPTIPHTSVEPPTYQDNPTPVGPRSERRLPDNSPAQRPPPAPPTSATPEAQRPPLWVVALLGVFLMLGIIAFALVLPIVPVGHLFSPAAESPTGGATVTPTLRSPATQPIIVPPVTATATTVPPTATSAPPTTAPPTFTPTPTATARATPIITSAPKLLIPTRTTATATARPAPAIYRPTSTPYPTKALQATQANSTGSSKSAGAAASKQGCYLIQNQLGPELTVTITRQVNQKAFTFKIPSKQEHEVCLDPGRYTFTIDAPPPWGTADNVVDVLAGDNYYYPVRAGE